MPTYDYRCDANGMTLEVHHPMADRIETWGELCKHLGIEPGKTEPEQPVHKLANGGNIIRSKSLGSGQAPPCERGMPCCGGQFCEN